MEGPVSPDPDVVVEDMTGMRLGGGLVVILLLRMIKHFTNTKEVIGSHKFSESN